MAGNSSMPILKRAATFVSMLALSVYLFPAVGFPLASIGVRYIGNFSLFWSQWMLLPNGFVNNEIGPSQAFFMDSAIFGAVFFWLLFSAFFGYIFRAVKIGIVILAVYPVTYVVMFAFYSVLGLFGYSTYLDGP